MDNDAPSHGHEGASSGQLLGQPLTDAEYDQLEDCLESFDEEQAMNLEEMDGFFTALICGPSVVLPREYLNEIWGSSESCEEWTPFESTEEFKGFLHLVMRHWNHVARALQTEEFFMPMLMTDDGDEWPKAHDWARGFVRGMSMRPDEWDVLVRDEDDGSAVLPVFVLMHEQRPEDEVFSFIDEKAGEIPREELLAALITGTMHIYKYFRQQRRKEEAQWRRSSGQIRRAAHKTGRNVPCPCGSGKKYKHCCGGAAIQ